MSHLRPAPRATLAVFVLALCAGAAAAGPHEVRVGDEDGDGRRTGADIELALSRCHSGCVLRIPEGRFEDVALELVQAPPGVQIVGAGAGRTVLRAPVPMRRPLIRPRGVEGLVLRDLTLDGRKSLQPDEAVERYNVGIFVVNSGLRSSPGGLVQRVEIRGFLSAGVRIRNGRNWTIRDSWIHDIGCHPSVPCPHRTDEGKGYVEGRKVQGYGVQLINHGASGARIATNLIERVSKIGVEAYTPRGDEPIDRWISDVLIEGNRVRGAVSGGIVVNRGRGIRIVGNEVGGSGGAGIRGWAGTGVACGSDSFDVRIEGNEIVGADGPGIRVACRGGRVRIAANRVTRACLAGLGSFGGIHVAPRTGRPQTLLLIDNRVEGGSCTWALAVRRWRDVVVAGGRYAGGRVSSADVRRSTGVRLRNVELRHPRGALFSAGPSVTKFSVAPAVLRAADGAGRAERLGSTHSRDRAPRADR